MPIKPSPTIAGKLRKLFNNNKQTIEPAIGDSIPGGSGGGANVLMLYLGEKDGNAWAYKNPQRTEEYISYKEASDAVRSADVIKLDDSEPGTENISFVTCWDANQTLESVRIYCTPIDEYVGLYANTEPLGPLPDTPTD